MHLEKRNPGAATGIAATGANTDRLAGKSETEHRPGRAALQLIAAFALAAAVTIVIIVAGRPA